MVKEGVSRGGGRDGVNARPKDAERGEAPDIVRAKRAPLSCFSTDCFKSFKAVKAVKRFLEAKYRCKLLIYKVYFLYIRTVNEL